MHHEEERNPRSPSVAEIVWQHEPEAMFRCQRELAARPARVPVELAGLAASRMVVAGLAGIDPLGQFRVRRDAAWPPTA